MNRRGKILLVGAMLAFGAAEAAAQFPAPGGGRPFPSPMFFNEDDMGSIVRLEGGAFIDEDRVRTAREVDSHSTGTPTWSNQRGFEKDVFTFARIIFKSGLGTTTGWGRGRNLGWWVDFPDADLNLSYRLQQMTSMKVDPDGRVLKLSDPELFNFPLIYMEHAGYMKLRENEVTGLRKYMLNGGALFVNDFWSEVEWQGFAAQMKRVFPERAWVDLTLDHPVFHTVFDLKGPMSALQAPTMQFWQPASDHDSSIPMQDRSRGEGSDTVHIRGMFDDKGRMMAIVIHNSDISDGWEHEGKDPAYFHRFAEKICYPLGVNIVFYLMTH